jgi:hypothetical protein
VAYAPHHLQRTRFSSLINVLTGPTFFRYALVLIIIDLVFITLHLLYELSYNSKIIIINKFYLTLDPNLFKITEDRSYSEFYEYGKSSLCCVGLLLIYRRTKLNIYLILSLIYAFITLDNAFSIHEQLGSISTHISTGELMVFIGYAALIVLILWRFYPNDSPENFAYITGLIFFIGVIGFFAGGIDFLHATIPRFIPHTGKILGLLEDGGELIALSLNTALVWSIVANLNPKASGD